MFPRLLVFGLLTSSARANTAQGQCWRDTTCTGPRSASFPGPWESNNFSPASRTVSPIRVLDRNHNHVSSWPSVADLSGNGSMHIFDFGREVGGVLTVGYTACGSGSLGLSFSEASNFTGFNSDESNGGSRPDGSLSIQVDSSNCATKLSYTTPDARQRGGFRYLTIYTISNSTAININVNAISLNISFQPTWADLRAYQGYFHSSDELLNRIWYAGAYTIQTTTIPSNTGREFPPVSGGWMNDAQLGSTAPAVIVDGAKRDRAIWAGDLGIATRSALVSIGDMESVKNALQVQYQYQENTGELPMVGPPINFYTSDTYHMATLIGTFDYVLFSGDEEFLNTNWAKYQKALSFVIAKIDKTGMMNITGTLTWGRTARSDGHTTDGNMLLYRSLVTGAIMAQWRGDTITSYQYGSLAESVKTAVNKYNWDSTKGAFKNSDQDNSVYPEDGNSMALYYNGTSPSQAKAASSYLKTNWGPVGAVTPELPDNVVPYVESFEVKAHLAARQAKRSLDLMRLSWGWYLNNPYGTQSTCLEGYRSDGSFKYQDSGYNKGGAYISHSHGWSTGPTDALTSYIVGLQLTAPGGKTWVVEPQFGDLKFAQAGFTTPIGKFSSGWALTTSGYKVTINTPAHTSGLVVVPFPQGGNRPCSVLLNGRQVPYRRETGPDVITFKIEGGKHTVEVSKEVTIETTGEESTPTH